ncbi:hypothetical protein NY2A_B113R [Paramecium bursaria Chlorella virus NY2A]|uniref:Uncharacterized protein B113R n=1 Tax=Paramecium bursaria Chlorella virus NY2A TaxID=46021 RepID=A7IVY8_PBCVN|nr:hypothetical protein NY2A_B113R [Paramecium bursaria Chlorella virus NY2A]ABT14512.1 hypothetical protein NY2A_B113R [Paramecium bursaria Chlorella virus NY2A]
MYCNLCDHMLIYSFVIFSLFFDTKSAKMRPLQRRIKHYACRKTMSENPRALDDVVANDHVSTLSLNDTHRSVCQHELHVLHTIRIFLSYSSYVSSSASYPESTKSRPDLTLFSAR